MKRLLIVPVFVLISLSVFSQWDTAFYRKDLRVDDFWIFDKDSYVVAASNGHAGFIYTTSDGGQSFYVYTVDAWIKCIQFVGDSIGYAAPNKRTGIYKTVDKGRTWDFLEGSLYFGDVYSMYFFDERIGKVDWKWTYDGGQSWEYGEYIGDIARESDKVAYGSYHEGIMKTVDKGRSWNVINDSLERFKVYIIDSSHYIAYHYDGRIYHSYDSLKSFSDSLRIDGYEGLKISFSDSYNGYAVLDRYNGNDDVFITNDGGYNWTKCDIFYNGIKSVHCTRTRTYINDGRALLESPNGPIGPVNISDPNLPSIKSKIEFQAWEAENILLRHDEQDNLYICCDFRGELVIGDTTISHPWDQSLLIAKFDLELNLLWIHTISTKDQTALDFNFDVFPDGKSVVELELYMDYYLDSNGPFSIDNLSSLLVSYDADGKKQSIILLEGDLYEDYSLVAADNSKVYLGGGFFNHICINQDSLFSDYANFLLIWDVSQNIYSLQKIADHTYFFPLNKGTNLTYDHNTDNLFYGFYYTDTVIINNQFYSGSDFGTKLSLSFLMLKMDPMGNILDINQEIIKYSTGGSDFYLLFNQHGQFELLGAIYKYDALIDNTIYNSVAGSRPFTINLDNDLTITDVYFPAGDQENLYSFSKAYFQNYTVYNSSQAAKSQLGNDIIYNLGEFDADLVLTFYTNDRDYSEYYQVIDPGSIPSIVTINDRYYLSSSSDGRPIYYSNDTISMSDYGHYYIAELDFQYLKIKEKEDVRNEELIIYPNPAKHQFVIDIPENYSKSTLQLFNIHGKLIYSKAITSAGRQSIRIDYNPGLYFVKVSNANESITGKVLLIE